MVRGRGQRLTACYMWLKIFHGEDERRCRLPGQQDYFFSKRDSGSKILSILTNVRESRGELVSAHIQPVFPQLVVTQIQNSLAVRQLLPKGPGNFELVFYFFGYADDTPEMRMHRIKQANMVGPAGLVSMEDALATELVQSGTAGSSDALSLAEMGRDLPDDQQIRSSIAESQVRSFRRGYQALMGCDQAIVH